MTMLPPNVRRVLLTGGAGFIGSHVLDMLVSSGISFTVFDDLSNGRLEFIDRHLRSPNVTFVEGSILDSQALTAASADQDLVWHLAANTDIIGSHEQPSRDLDALTGTFNVLEAMRRNKVRDLLFASSGAVYGSICHDEAVSEAVGPLLPVSTYGASKIGCEAFISSYCHVYGLRAWMYRFGNVIGARMTHGVIFDFIKRLRDDPSHLLIRGDGRQEKNYFLVEECIDGMMYGYRAAKLDDENPCDVFNLGTTGVTRVIDIATMVIEEMGLNNARVEIEGTRRAWPGDQPRVHFTVDRMTALGWRTRLDSNQSVRTAIQRALGKRDGMESVL
jgi:UDP-glucose 4-epimerase